MAVLFRTTVDVEKHFTKKNGKGSGFNPRTGKSWVFRKPEAVKAQAYLETVLRSEKNKQLHGQTITGYIHVLYYWYFEDYYTKKMQRNRKVADFDNLCGLPNDALVGAGIIVDDHFIEHHDGSRRRPADKNKLEIIIMSIDETR